MKPQQQIKTGFVSMGIWIAMGCWALAIFLTDETAEWGQFLFNIGLVIFWIIWSLLRIRNGRRMVREASVQTGQKA